MAIKLFENISSVQNVPAATSDTPRDRYKPVSLYLVGAGTGEWKVTVSYSPVNSSVYKKLGPVFTLSVSNTNPFQLFSWDYDCDSFVAWVSEIKGNATATLWMTQGNARNLDYLLMTEPTARLKADPTDIPNCSLEYTPDGWVGNMGVFSTYGALLANPTNALVPGKVWAIVASASSFAKYNYMSSGWVLENSIGATGASNVPGSPSTPFATVEELNAAYPTGGPYPAFSPSVVNPLSPCGSTFAHWNGAKWVPLPGQLIAQWKGGGGAPFLERTAAGLTLGQWAVVWAPDDPLPDWLICNPGERIGSLIDAAVETYASAANVEHRYSIRTAPQVGGDIYSQILSGSGSAANARRGFGQAEVASTVNPGGTITGVTGNAPYNSGGFNSGREAVGTWALGQTKPYISLKPGAETDSIKIYSVQIWARG